MDEIGMRWETDHGKCFVTEKSIDWIMDNVKSSQYTQDRCYVYNKAFARYYDNNDAHATRTGGLFPTGMKEQNGKILNSYIVVYLLCSQKLFAFQFLNY